MVPQPERDLPNSFSLKIVNLVVFVKNCLLQCLLVMRKRRQLLIWYSSVDLQEILGKPVPDFRRLSLIKSSSVDFLVIVYCVSLLVFMVEKNARRFCQFFFEGKLRSVAWVSLSRCKQGHAWFASPVYICLSKVL